jgi:hypothetical protein
MHQKTALIIAAGATAFMLVSAGAIIRVASSQPRQVGAQAPSPTKAAPTPDVPTPQNQQYQQLIREANARIEKLKDENARLREQVKQASASNAAAVSQISAQDAAQTALNLAPGARLISMPQLVDFGGTPAFEVTLDAGTVYVDAASGQAIYAIPARERGQFGEEGREDHEEREEHDAGGSSS